MTRPHFLNIGPVKTKDGKAEAVAVLTMLLLITAGNSGTEYSMCGKSEM